MFQYSMFDYEHSEKKIKKPLRLIELFAGYGSQHFALDYLGVPFESWRIAEWAVKSIQAYKDAHFPDDDTDYSEGMDFPSLTEFLFEKGISADYNQPMTKAQIKRLGETACRRIYNNIKTTHNLVSVCNVHAKDLAITDTDKYEYMLTYSFPCQDLSLAGNRLGMGKDSGTRSGLLWEVERILRECDERPQILLMENVPDVCGKSNIGEFNSWLNSLEDMGYHNYYKMLNAKDYGIPQNRRRCFMVSLSGGYWYDFPKRRKLNLKLKDLLEDSVSEKYYLSQRAIEGKTITKYESRKLENSLPKNGNISSLKATGDKDQKCIIEAEGKTITDDKKTTVLVSSKGKKVEKEIDIAASLLARDYKGFPNQGANGVLEVDENYDLSPTLLNWYLKHSEEQKQRGNGFRFLPSDGNGCARALCTKTNDRMDGNYIIRESNSPELKKVFQLDGYESSGRVYPEQGLSPTLNTCGGGEHEPKIYNNLRIRRLTPKECFRLMGVRDDDYERIAVNQSKSSLYHLAGDSIVVNVLCAIIGKMYEEETR